MAFMWINPFALGANYAPNAVDFDGSTTYLDRGGGLTGALDAPTGIFYVFFRLDGSDGSNIHLLDTDTDERIRIMRSNLNKLNFSFGNNGGTSVFQMTSSATLTSGSSWISILASWNTNFVAGNKIGHLYINDSSDSFTRTDANGAFDISYASQATNWRVGYDSSAGVSSPTWNGCVSEFYFAPGQFLDFSDVNNRRKFIDASNKPISLGSDGSTPTGTAPKIYLRNEAATYGTNSGTGGNFTAHGTFGVCSSSPGA